MAEVNGGGQIGWRDAWNLARGKAPEPVVAPVGNAPALQAQALDAVPVGLPVGNPGAAAPLPGVAPGVAQPLYAPEVGVAANPLVSPQQPYIIETPPAHVNVYVTPGAQVAQEVVPPGAGAAIAEAMPEGLHQKSVRFANVTPASIGAFFGQFGRGDTPAAAVDAPNGVPVADAPNPAAVAEAVDHTPAGPKPKLGDRLLAAVRQQAPVFNFADPALVQHRAALDEAVVVADEAAKAAAAKADAVARAARDAAGFIPAAGPQPKIGDRLLGGILGQIENFQGAAAAPGGAPLHTKAIVGDAGGLHLQLPQWQRPVLELGPLDVDNEIARLTGALKQNGVHVPAAAAEINGGLAAAAGQLGDDLTRAAEVAGRGVVAPGAGDGIKNLLGAIVKARPRA